MKNTLSFLSAFSLLLLFTACSNDDETPIVETDYSDIISNIGNNVIVATYADLAAKGLALQNATSTLEADPTTANMIAAREAWVVARSPWEQSEGFLFGPVDEEGLDPSMDSWPVNVTDLNNVLNSSSELTATFLHAQEGTLKGFHTIEYLLWGENGNKAVSDFTDREFEYLAAASEALANDTEALANLWTPSDGNYVSNLITAGSNNIFPSQKSALEQITDALVIISDEVANGKINDPFSEKDLTLEESRFSANSKADFSNNIRSIQNIYLGKYGSNGNNNGISTIIAEMNAELDLKVRTEIETAINSIVNIPGTFSDAIFQNPTDVAAAQQSVRALQATLESQVLPAIRDL
jgi:uncharacterized iron-regulated protein